MPRIESSREGAGILRQQLLPPFNRPLCCLLAERFSSTADPIQFTHSTQSFASISLFVFPRPGADKRDSQRSAPFGKGFAAVNMSAAGRRLFDAAAVNINWFPGHMAAATRKIEQRLKVVDMVLEVRDARVPLCSECAQLGSLIQNKRRIIVMNKSDLIGSADTERWVRYFAQQGQAVTFTNAAKGSRIGDLMPRELLRRGLLSRADRMLLFMIIGVPNTGKSTMINALRRSGMRERRKAGGGGNVAETGARPGVTRQVSTMQFCSEPPAFLIDTPGIMKSALGPEDGLKLALTGAIKENIVDPVTLADYLLFLLNQKGQLSYVSACGLTAPSDDIDAVLDSLAGKMGFNLKKQAGERGKAMREERPSPRGASALSSSNDAYLKARRPAQKPQADLRRSAQHLIKLYRGGALGKFVLDDLENRLSDQT